MRTVLITLISLFSFSGLADTKLTGKELLKSIRSQTQAQGFDVSKLPQNVGGTGAKLMQDQSAKLSGKTLEIGLSDEAVFEEVEKSVFATFEEGLQKKDLSAVHFSKSSGAYSFNFSPQTGAKNFEGISVKGWSVKSDSVSLQKFNEQFKKYLAGFKRIDFVEVSPYSTKTPLSRRVDTTFRPNFFAVDVRVDIRGLNQQNNLQQDKFDFSVNVEKSDAAWMVTSFALNSGETMTAKKPVFKEVQSFADAGPSNYLRREAIRRGGYAISMCDYNSDGHVDMVVGHMGAMEIFKGSGNGKFEKMDVKALGLDGDTLVKSIACDDFDNDGQKDLLVVRFAPSEQKGNDLVLYHNTGKKFTKATSIRNRQPAYYAMPSAVADYNGDGLLDFYVGFPGAKDFTVLNKNANGFVGLKEAHPQGLFYNLGNFTFNEVTKEKIPYTKTKNAYNDGYPESAVIFPHTSMGVDYNLDGNMDIVVVDDKANLSPLYKNTGNGNFVQIADKIGVSNSDFGMGFMAADLDNDGYLEFIYTNVNFLPFERLHNSLINNFSEYSQKPGTYGVRIFKTKDGKNYSDVTALSGITNAGYGVGGVEVIDYNNDGNFDIYIPNGLWSGNDKRQDISSLFTRAFLKFGFDYEEVLGTQEGVEQANTSFMKILTEFRGDVTTMKVDENIHPSMTGFQRNRLFRNNGDGTFTDVAFVLGVDSIHDGYVVATADVNHDGKMDLVLRNSDPGSDKNMFPAVQVYMNESNINNKSVILTLEGTRSNRDAVGAIVEAQIGKKTLVRHLIANNGAAQSQNLIHFGLGSSKKIDSLKIRWPSGVVDIHKGIGPGYHQYKESNNSISALEK